MKHREALDHDSVVTVRRDRTPRLTRSPDRSPYTAQKLVSELNPIEYSLRWDPPIACAGATLLIPG